jgi:hypothetical protein
MILRFFIPALLLCVFAPLVVAEVLFEDDFGASLRPDGFRAQDLDYMHDKRQSGALSPATYNHSGGQWQVQTRSFGKRIRFLIFPKREWLGVTPVFQLPAEDGHYELSFDFSCPLPEGVAQGGERTGPPGEVALVIGRDGPAGVDDPGFEGTLAVILPVEPEGPSRFLIDGVEAAFIDPASTDDLDASRRQNLTIRWTQSDGRVTGSEASVNGQGFPSPATGVSFSMASPRVMVAGRLITKLHPEQNYAQVQLLRLVLSQE